MKSITDMTANEILTDFLQAKKVLVESRYGVITVDGIHPKSPEVQKKKKRTVSNKTLRNVKKKYIVQFKPHWYPQWELYLKSITK
jgi:hypothetical protein